jgi:hypothetical protein
MLSYFVLWPHVVWEASTNIIREQDEDVDGRSMFLQVLYPPTQRHNPEDQNMKVKLCLDNHGSWYNIVKVLLLNWSVVC